MKKKVGRKQFDGKNEGVVLKKLEEAYSWGCTDAEAAIYSNISTSTLYKYQKENPGFLERKELLKSKVILQARRAVIDSFKEKPGLAFKYLERKLPNEFQVKVVSIIDIADDHEINEATEEQKRIVADYLKKKELNRKLRDSV
ncbi:MAG: hypothetical protein KKF65_05660 [Nanoarchaeota archaeon]|nr:hypothetical protein [Nanoarchaeota archaeon]